MSGILDAQLEKPKPEIKKKIAIAIRADLGESMGDKAIKNYELRMTIVWDEARRVMARS
jgi:hypothetical protein